jgi:glucose-6-phosphate isomerase
LIEERTPDVRRLSEIRELLYDRAFADSAEDRDLYYMYRDLARNEEEREKIHSQHLRYDITIIPPNMLGVEFTKTAGHFHPEAVAGVSYPEVYEVLEGEALYLMQKEDLSDVYIVEAEAGDKVIIPPNYGHITINPSNKPLKMGNWVCADFSSIYAPFREKRGGAYYKTTSGWIENPSYGNLPKMRIVPPTNFENMGLTKGSSMYGLVERIESLSFLRAPQNFSSLFEQTLSL